MNKMTKEKPLCSNIQTNIEGIKLNDDNLDYHIDLLRRNTIEERDKEWWKKVERLKNYLSKLDRYDRNKIYTRIDEIFGEFK